MNVFVNAVFWLAIFAAAACGCYFASFAATSLMVKILPALQEFFQISVIACAAILTIIVCAGSVLLLGSRHRE